MNGCDEVMVLLEAGGGVLRRADHPALRTAIDSMLRRGTGEIARILPGVIVAGALAEDFTTRVAAVMLWRPDAIITGPAAARLGYWPERQVTDIDVIIPHYDKASAGVRIHRTALPLDHMVERDGVRWTHPGWTSVWLAEWDQGTGIDEALRRGAASLAEVRGALESMSRRIASPLRRFAVVNSAEQPWSPAERRWHMMLREHRIEGWTGNVPLELDGEKIVVDVAMEQLKLAMEVQSVAHHTDPVSFYDGQLRIARLVANGWTYFPVTVPMMDDEATLMALLRATVIRCQLEQGLVPDAERRRPGGARIGGASGIVGACAYTLPPTMPPSSSRSTCASS